MVWGGGQGKEITPVNMKQSFHAAATAQAAGISLRLHDGTQLRRAETDGQ